jgi:hypothetical protein
MQKEPQEITSTPLPPGYDYETALKRHRQQEKSESEYGGWDQDQGAPNRSKRLYLRLPDGSWQDLSAKYFDDNVFWAFTPTLDEQKRAVEQAVEIITREEYYRNRINTPAAQGKNVTRYVVPTFREYVTTSEEKAREKAEEEGISWDEVRADEGLRILHGKTGQFSKDKWTYWSDDSMSSGMDKDEIGDMSAAGNGQFSEAAEELLTWYWKAGGDQTHFSGGKERLTKAQDLEKTMVDSLRRRYGLVQYVNHDHSLKKVVVQTEEGLDSFYVLKTVYSGMAPDGFVDMRYEFFDGRRDARVGFQSGHPARKARKSKYQRDREEFRRRHSPMWVIVEEDGTVVEGSERLFTTGSSESTEVRVNRPFVPRQHSAEGCLLYGLGHYVVTGRNFGEGVTYREGGNIHVTLGIQTGRHGGGGREEKGWRRLLRRLAEIGGEVSITEMGERDGTLWREVVVPIEEAHDLGDALTEEAGTWGWGWTKEVLDECIDQNQ